MTTTWWWIRHAPVRDHDGILYGDLDVEADCSDADKFDTLRTALPARTQWLTSPLKRARQTATALRLKTDAKLQIIDAFKEQNFGSWQGQRYSALEWPDDPARFRPPGGESLEDVVTRVSSTILDLSDTMPEHVIVIAHAGVIRAALALALGLKASQALKFDIAPLSLTRLTRFGEGQWRVDATNQILG